MILVVEDDEDTYELYSEVLAAAGYSVIGANNGVEAVTAAIRDLPDLVVMDVALPGRNGLEAARLIKADQRSRHIPILALSGFVQNCFVQLAHEVGCNSFLSKPCPLAQLLKEVDRLLSSRTQPRRGVLIVEDDQEIRDVMQAILGDEGFSVSTAANGREALDHLHAASTYPGLILLDLMMPVMDGWQLRSALRNEPTLSTIPIVVLTAVRPAEDYVHSLDVSAFLTKPIDMPALLGAVERYC